MMRRCAGVSLSASVGGQPDDTRARHRGADVTYRSLSFTSALPQLPESGAGAQRMPIRQAFQAVARIGCAAHGTITRPEKAADDRSQFLPGERLYKFVLELIVIRPGNKLSGPAPPQGEPMKKSTASITLAAVAGLTALTASPAMAAPFQNCGQAEAAGVFNIPVGNPAYSPDLDSDSDGVACENGNVAFRPDLVPAGDVTVTPTPAPAPAPAPGQVAKMPVGGAATGVAQDTSDNTAVMALGAGFVLAAVAGGAFVVRRRSVQA